MELPETHTGEAGNYTTAVIIGGGITGLSLAAQLDQGGADFVLLEKQDRFGGQIKTLSRDGYRFEVGPNTGSISTPEVVELFRYANPDLLQVADRAAKSRWIFKKGRFHPLPSGLFSAITTPLFTLRDKFRILAEPLRQCGTDPDETVGQLAERRLGKSFVDYAVDPFISGVYAGNPYRLVTRHALPKLYRLEHEHGSFIRGTLAKARQPKSERDKLATKEVFSAHGGLERLVEALVARLSVAGTLVKSVRKIHIFEANPADPGRWKVAWSGSDGTVHQVFTDWVVSTVRADELVDVLPYSAKKHAAAVAELPYSPVIEVCVGFDHLPDVDRRAFGGLVPSVEERDVLGILFPSSCFSGRTPHRDSALFTIFMGGIRRGEQMLNYSDQELINIGLGELKAMLQIPDDVEPSLTEVTRYPKAIPQYQAGYENIAAAIDRIQQECRGFIVAGGVRDGIGLAHRITQGAVIGASILDAMRAERSR